MAGRGRKDNVVKLKRRPSLMAGFLLLAFSAYLLVLFFQSFTQEHVSIYEVTEKKMADDESVRGIILRQEKLVNTSQAGYINYYVGEGARVGRATTVYSLDQTGVFADTISSLDMGELSLSAENTDMIRNAIANYRDSFSLADYHGITNFKYNMENTLLQMTTVNLLEQLDEVMKKTSGKTSLRMVKAKDTGIISFCSDGLEDLTVDKLTAENFSDMTDDWEQLRQTSEMKKESPVYRLVTGEKWDLVIPLSEHQKEKLAEKQDITITVKKNNLKLVPDVTVFTIDSKYYARLSFDKYMLLYLDNRYLDVQIQFNDADGLKIPVSSILTKSFYVVPKSFIIKGGQNGSNGVMMMKYEENGDFDSVFHEVDIYYEDENENYYIGQDDFEPGTTIIGDNNFTSMQMTVTAELEGVYNCNRGYCEFRRIEKLYKNEEYAIVKKDTSYGLSTYDHIILNPDMIGENDIIY